ncbi:uncharacterized protein LOC106533867 isoform X2 [Austrofundulus limnaeus]|uniref:Uncharacterized protein LOC106533867 isoform X2 n=1 Tax=Austrofundulus limnaeus TaxID=52670 RepID=A0A2I4D0K5_AUSLI|nr:PREDICTED: uncharacterized protein LOC106533867 isoform X2 [Austrofundulus limnaeus]
MRSLIFIVVTSLVIIIAAAIPLEELKYGDIIAFPRTTVCGVPYTYKHYGIFLDKKRFPDQKEDDNLFHFTGPVSTKKLTGCIFDKLKPGDVIERDNFLDDIPLIKENNLVSEDRITKRIAEKYKSCKMWKPTKNNCEHLSTYVRYGLKISLQCGQNAAKIVKNPDVRKTILKEIKTQLEVKGLQEEMELDLDIAEGFWCEGCDICAKADDPDVPQCESDNVQTASGLVRKASPDWKLAILHSPQAPKKSEVVAAQSHDDNEACAQVKPGDWVLRKVARFDWRNPRWQGPFKTDTRPIFNPVKNSHTCLAMRGQHGGTNVGELDEAWFGKLVDVTSWIISTKLRVSRADVFWFCGGKRLLKILPTDWDGRCAEVSLVSPVRFVNFTVEDSLAQHVDADKQVSVHKDHLPGS